MNRTQASLIDIGDDKQILLKTPRVIRKSDEWKMTSNQTKNKTKATAKTHFSTENALFDPSVYRAVGE